MANEEYGILIFSSSYVRILTWTYYFTARPCPFYSQGRCLFAESCNFLHDANAQNPSNGKGKHSLHESSTTASATPTNYAKSRFPVSSPRSPTRSPRMSGLLLALQDVIGPTLDDEQEEGEEAVAGDMSFSEELQACDTFQTPLIQSNTDLSHSQSQTLAPQNDSLMLLDRSNLPSPAPGGDDSGNATEEATSVIFGSDDYHSEDGEPTNEPGTARPLMQVALAQAVPIIPVESTEEETPTAERNDPLSRPSIGTDADQPPPPPPHSQPKSPTTLLSPVAMSIIPLLSDLRPREDSIDSGYAEGSWSGPSVLATSPPRDKRLPTATVEVSFTAESSSSLSSSPRGVQMHTLSSEVESLLSPQQRTSPTSLHSTKDQSDTDPSDVALPFGPVGEETSADTSAIIQDDVQKAINRESPRLASEDPSHEKSEPDVQSPLVYALRSLQSFVAEHREDEDLGQDSLPGSPYPPPPPDVSSQRANPADGLASAKKKWGEVIGELSTLSLDILPLDEMKQDEELPTASVATRSLPCSPTTPARNNTLDSLYGCYSTADTEADTEAETSTSPSISPVSSKHSAALTSPPTSAEIVGNIYEPLLRGRGGLVRSTSASASSSDTRLGSPFRDHSSAVVPGTVRDKSKAKGKAPVRPKADVSIGERQWSEAIDAEGVSTKVPFGFRYPFSVVCTLQQYCCIESVAY